MQPYKRYRGLLDAAERWPLGLPARLLGRLYRLAKRRLVFAGDWDLQGERISEMPTYRNLEGLYRVMPDYRGCEWYRRALQQIESGIPYHHNIHLQARSQAELDGLFEHHFMPLLSSMASQGYRHQEGADLPDGMVTRHGELLKTERGRHRLAAAQIVGADTLYPLRIVAVHRAWWRGQGKGVAVPPRRNFEAALDEVYATSTTLAAWRQLKWPVGWGNCRQSDDPAFPPCN